VNVVDGRRRDGFPLAQNFWNPWAQDFEGARCRVRWGTDGQKIGGCEAGGTGALKRGVTGFAGQPGRQF
jgi:hypothetical protein